MNKRNIAIIVGVLAVGLIAICLVAVALYVLRPSAEASGPIEAIVLDTPTTEDQAADPTTSNSTNMEETEEMTEESAGGTELYEIVQAESEVRFILTEVLGGKPTTVTGVTDQVAGQIEVDFGAPGNSRVGVILINARTLSTGNGKRDRMIQNEILDTADYEFVEFTPTSIAGLPASVQIGDTFSFTITGNLTIRNVTNEVTFNVELTLESETRITGSASTVILRAGYGLNIPSVPNVADVSEEVIIEIDFVAVLK